MAVFVNEAPSRSSVDSARTSSVRTSTVTSSSQQIADDGKTTYQLFTWKLDEALSERTGAVCLTPLTLTPTELVDCLLTAPHLLNVAELRDT
eukprot:405977-Prorocentrum_minimum.AAC.1